MLAGERSIAGDVTRAVTVSMLGRRSFVIRLTL